jgi:hypothetical protein
MSIHARRNWLLGLALAGLLQPSASAAGTRGVQDGGGLFPKPDVVADINRQIEEIYQRYGLELCIETYAAVPANRAAELKQLGESKFFRMWAEERALVAGADGLYILVSNSPRHVEVVAETDAQSAFDKRARDKVRKALVHKLDRNRAEALQDAVAAVRDHLESKAQAAKRGGWLWLVWVMLAILGLWLAVALVRRFRGEKTVAPPTAISSSALAGQSIYHSVVHKTSAPAPASAETLPYPPPSEEPKPEGTVHG